MGEDDINSLLRDLSIKAYLGKTSGLDMEPESPGAIV